MVVVDYTEESQMYSYHVYIDKGVSKYHRETWTNYTK